MANSYDLIAVGVGMASNNAAKKCASAGWSVAVVDELPYGGTCALRGCDPKKMLRRGAEIIDAANLMRGKGIEPGGLRINWADLVAHKRTFTDAMPGKIEGTLKTNEVATLRGTARFVGPTAIEVDGTRLQARHFLIATGAKPRPLDVPGAEHVIAADQFMELEDLPPRILFVGGGYISFEFAHIAARAGAVVRIIDRGEQPLKGFDPDLVEKLVDRTRKVGIEIHLGAPLVSIVKSGGFLVTAGTEGGLQEWNVDLVVQACASLGPARPDCRWRRRQRKRSGSQ